MPERTPPLFKQRLHPLTEIFRSCDSRKYTYFFPSYLLIPPKPGSGLYETFRRQTVPLSNSAPNADASTNSLHRFWAGVPSEPSKDDDLQRNRRWRAEPEAV